MAQNDARMKDSPDLFFDSQEGMDFEELDIDDIIDKEQKKSQSWRGTPLNEIYNGDTPWVAPEFPTIIPGYNHSVLYHIPKSSPSKLMGCPPAPQNGKDLWDKNYVRMPYSKESLYPVEECGKVILKNRWSLIVNALSKPIRNSEQFESAVLEYNTKFQKLWKFETLHTLFGEHLDEDESEFFFTDTLPRIKELVLKTPQIIPSPIPLLRQGQNRSISLSQWQIACLLANAFFCTFPRRNSRKANSEYSSYPDINFNRLFMSGSNSVLEKVKCICHYFRRVCIKVPTGVVTFTRHSVDLKDCPDWSKSGNFVGSVPIHVNSKGTIEDDGVGLLQVDFANKFLGGGVLNYGCVQEEIRFVICPEFLVSMLFTECLKSTEALLMIGCERYSNYRGYSDSFIWHSNHEDKTVRDSNGRLRCAVIAIDALQFYNSSVQYRTDNILRELNKAHVGFSIHTNSKQLGMSLPGVATGNWGCGAFCGSPYIKSLIQLMACCVSRRPFVYYTFNDVELRDDIINIYNFLSQNNVTIGELYGYLIEFHKSSGSANQLYPFILQSFKDKQLKIEHKIPKIFKNFLSQSKPSTSVESDSAIVGKSFKLTGNNEFRERLGKSDMDSSEDSTISCENAGIKLLVEEQSLIESGSQLIKEQSDVKSTFFDQVSFITEVKDQIKKKRPLDYFDTSVSSDFESMHTEQEVKNYDKRVSSVGHSNKNDIQPRKIGKISDYFSPLHKK